MTPKRLWLNKIPTQCDVVIEFPGKNFFMFTCTAGNLIILMCYCANLHYMKTVLQHNKYN